MHFAGLALIALCVVTGLAFVFVVRVRSLRQQLRDIDQHLDPSTRPLAWIAVVVAAATTIVTMVWSNVGPPLAILLPMILGAGLFLIGIGVLAVEGMLLETSTDVAVRRQLRRPPPSSRVGRIVAISTGTALLAGVVAVYVVMLRA